MSHELVPVEPVQGRIVGPGEPSPGRNQTPYASPPPGKQLQLEYQGPATGTIVPGGAYGAFCLDGPKATKWQVQIPPFRVIRQRPPINWATVGSVPDLGVSLEYDTYDLHVLAMWGSGMERRYRFWSTLPYWEIDPGLALFLLIDAEPWQAQQCRVEMR